MTTEFDPGLLGGTCWFELSGGERIGLPVRRWRRPPGVADELLLGRCTGPTLDVGCGPGRLVAALGERGVATLGIDRSAVAVRLARRRGATALRRDVFGRLPAEGRWRHVLLADGNIGIGGDPVILLCRVADLLAESGTALVEVEPPGRGLRRERVRIGGQGTRSGHWFRWAWLGVDAVAAAAAPAGLRVRWTGHRDGRWVTELTRTGS
ncbi:methyltransferase family protein [Prauserella shujinwangii]|uniref:Methyltransferase family protein n=1 Tax=Prauserella shujinwangii TaxID=1453103 RepID=A0A2T0M0E5_9PSEU|nr:class I SAM-dependent methyltransferase [Prauserella shujinwangii]PRX50059.1 methyltransferase family protein [Prauserella shujinwangii]